MRGLTRNEFKRVARAAGLAEDDPLMSDPRATALVNAGIIIGVRTAHNIHEKLAVPDDPPPFTGETIPYATYQHDLQMSSAWAFFVGLFAGVALSYVYHLLTT